MVELGFNSRTYVVNQVTFAPPLIYGPFYENVSNLSTESQLSPLAMD
jgi:hypothetical protein